MQRKRKSDHNRHCMEEEEATMRSSSSGSGSNASSVPNSRWNPTNEQISFLETLYKQGVRTPTAEQIQEIAGKLREYGSIEGKNVFYWFQNHKARQRQKQKQETMACFNRLLRKTTLSVSPVSLLPHQRAIASLPPPVCANVPVVCGPYYFPHGFYPHYPQVVLPAATVQNRSREVPESQRIRKEYSSGVCSVDDGRKNTQQTLQLFPLHPTGDLLVEKTGKAVVGGITKGNEDYEVPVPTVIKLL